MIWPLQTIIGYGTKGPIYCPSLFLMLNILSYFFPLVLPENSTCPLSAPLFLFPISSSPSSEHFPREDSGSLLSLYLLARHLETSSVSTSLDHIQSSWCLISSLPYPPTLFLSISHLLSHPPSSWLVTKGLLITILHPCLSVISLQLFPSSPSCLYMIPFPFKFPLCLNKLLF